MGISHWGNQRCGRERTNTNKPVIEAGGAERNTASERANKRARARAKESERKRAKEKKSSERDFSKGECQKLLKYLIIEGFAEQNCRAEFGARGKN